MKQLIGIALSAAALALVGCGSSDSNDNSTPNPATSEVPLAAQQSSAGLVSYVGQLTDSSNDSSEPVLIGDATFPVDDTTETSL